MRELEFRIKGRSTERELKQRFGRSSVSTATMLVVVSMVVVLALSGHQGTTVSKHSAIVHGKEVKADRVLVLIDNSGSMDGTEAKVQAQLTQLTASGILVTNQVPVFGFAISNSDRFPLLRVLKERIAANPSIDTVYIISDFFGRDYSANTSAALDDFANTLRHSRLRLYWASVNEPPIATYVELARQFDGDVIPAE